MTGVMNGGEISFVFHFKHGIYYLIISYGDRPIFDPTRFFSFSSSTAVGKSERIFQSFERIPSVDAHPLR